MADKETGLNITVGAVADEGSAKKAAKDLAKGVLSSLKDGYIEVPAEIKVPIKNASKDLEKAQKDVITQWKKTFKEGFSSSAKDLDDLTEAYNKFKKLAGKEHKAGTKQYREINKLMAGQIQSYNAQKQARETKRVEQAIKSQQAKQRSTQIKSKRPRDFGTPSKEEIDANIRSEQKRRMRGIKSTLPAGYGNGWVNPSRTDEYNAKLSEISSYRSTMEKQTRQSQKEARKWERDSFTSKNVGVKKANKMADEAEKRGGNKNLFTPNQIAGQLSDILRSNILPDLLGKIRHSETDEEMTKLTDEFFDTVDTISKYSIDAGRLILNDTKQTIGVVMGKLGYTTTGNIGGTEGDDKTEASRDPKIVPVLKDLLDKIGEREEAIKQELIRLEELEKTTHKTKKVKEVNSIAKQLVKETHDDKKVSQSKTKRQKTTKSQTTETDVKPLDKVSKKTKSEQLEDSYKSILEIISENVKSILDNIKIKGTKAGEFPSIIPPEVSKTIEDTMEKSNLPALYRYFKDGKWITAGVEDKTPSVEGKVFKDITDHDKLRQRAAISEVNKEYESLLKGTHPSQQRSSALGLSQNLAKAYNDNKVLNAIKNAFRSVTTKGTALDIMGMNQAELEKLRAERIATFGLPRTDRVGATGGKAQTQYIKALYGWGKRGSTNPFENLKLTSGIGIDSKGITEALQTSIQKNMFGAQTGGIMRNIIGSMTGYIGMPSLEKSRAEVEGLNQIMANIRQVALDLLQSIQSRETDLRGLEATGKAKFDDQGMLMEGSDEAAQKLFADMEEQKLALQGVLAEANMVDQVVASTGRNVGKTLQQLGFVSPELRKNNTIIQNINAGLDKNGKALKFQTRTAEVLNYSFQLMSRHIGKMWKNWMVQLNPITQIKKIFGDFMSYDIKWKRTMNVIKYNLRSIVKPFMEWIAQSLVNAIGFLDIISMKIQEAFGNTPVSLFDQVAADAEKTAEEIQNVTAGFDELHDIGADNSGENDLFGEIYKPQLSKEWEDLAKKIGDLFAGLIKGDLGFGDVMKAILGILWDTLKIIAKGIWDWFKQTGIGKYITEHWKDILGKVLAAFLAWKLLKVAGKLLWNALFGNFGGSAIGAVFSKLGGWILKALGATAFGKGIIEGVKTLFLGGGGLLSTLKSIFVGHEAITAFGAWGETLGALFAQTLLAAVGIAIGVGGIAKGFDMVADVKSYNMGLLGAGGKDKDKKSDFGGKAIGTIFGGIGGGIAGTAIAGLATGGPIGLAIGAIAGLLITSLAPAFEEVEVASKKANNEMQKIEYYEGQVKGVQTQVNVFDEQLKLLNQSLETQTQKVYEQGEKLGISKTRMDELVKATQDGTFSTDLLTDSETGLATSLTDLAQKQEHVTEVSKKLEEAQKKLLKAQTELSIAQDVEAKNFELAAARIELAEAQGVYSTEDATKKRIQLYKQAGKEERTNLLQNLTDDQRARMAEYKAVTNKELGELSKIWHESSDDMKKAFLEGVGSDTQQQFQQGLDSMTAMVEQHKGFWQRAGDTIKEIFSFGNATTWTYNAQAKYDQERIRYRVQAYDIGTNYVPNDGLAYLHQGEAVIPAKYNTPYQQGNLSNEERAYMQQIMTTMRSLDGTMKRGIAVNGQFVQRGSDLVAVVNKTNSQTGADLLSNVSYAR